MPKKTKEINETIEHIKDLLSPKKDKKESKKTNKKVASTSAKSKNTTSKTATKTKPKKRWKRNYRNCNSWRRFCKTNLYIINTWPNTILYEQRKTIQAKRIWNSRSWKNSKRNGNCKLIKFRCWRKNICSYSNSKFCWR